jgi:hypothetical protein
MKNKKISWIWIIIILTIILVGGYCLYSVKESFTNQPKCRGYAKDEDEYILPVEYAGFISEKEADYILKKAEPLFKESLVVSGKDIDVRKSETAWLPKSDKVIKDIIQRVCRLSDKPFERTYRTASNLDDRYENGVHDLLKFIKFGYGRASDHASKDIRTGYMTRAQGIEMVRKYDHVVSNDLYHWLDYVGLSLDEFWVTADGFRDSRVWWIQNGCWWKDNIWGEASPYGPVHLSIDMQKKYLQIKNN